MEQIQGVNSYRNILKRISAFGGVQAFNVLVTIARGKLVAMFLGPAGMGVSSLFTSAVNAVQQVGSLGLNLAMVKETAAAKDDADKLRRVLYVSLRLTLWTALLGGALCFLLSPLLSRWSFGSGDYSVGFMLLSASVSLSVASSAFLALLQGLGAVKRLALASVVGGLAGLLFGMPLYYFFGTRGIVPAMIVLSLCTFIFNYVSYRNSAPKLELSLTLSEFKPHIIRLLKMGAALMAGSLAYTLSTYLVNAFIRSIGSMDDVGLYQSANSITSQYISIVLSALALDYFPRLSAVTHDRMLFNDVLNRQMEIVALVLTPLIIALIVTAPWVIRLLLTAEFLPTIALTRWLGLGMLVKIMYFPLGYVFLAENNARLYLWSEVVFGSLTSFLGSILGYYAWGLNGLGIGLLLSELVANPVLYLVLHRYYRIRVEWKNVRLVAYSWGMGTATFIAMQWGAWLVGILLLVVSVTISVVMLWRRLR